MSGTSSTSLIYALVLGTSQIFGTGTPATGSPGSPAPPAATSGMAAEVPTIHPVASDQSRTAPTLGAPVAIERLGRMSGGDSSVDNDVTINGAVDGNSADGIVSGSNVIGGGAFDNASGINTVIQNSGSNVLIQNGMVVNVQFVPPAP